ncbi:recombinase family protein [Paenibacillus sp. FSL W7-1287]|uniref:recombinase family protein n=1 Tax=Paenibacillus sp. FSL W7-1287 TaxID=2954538 RepID=UPI0030F7B92D
MTTVLYMRSSTKLQRHSIDMQKTMAYKKAQENNAAFYKIYVDEHVSATLLNVFQRPGLRELLQAIENGQVSTVYVYKRDRLARNVEQYLKIYDTFKKHNISVIFTSDDEPPMQYTPIHQFIELIYAGIAEHESVQIKGRIQSAKNAKILNNQHPGGAKPYGYTLKNKKLNIVKSRAKRLQNLFIAICDTQATDLKQFYESIQGQPWFDSKWKYENIRNYIENKRYKGLTPLLINDEETEHEITDDETHPHRKYVFNPEQIIIEEKLWDAANQKLATLYKKSVNKAYPATHYLQGYLICSKCKKELIAYTLNDSIDIFFRCDKHRTNLQYASHLSNAILTSMTECLEYLFQQRFSEIVQQALNLQKANVLKRKYELKRQIDSQDALVSNKLKSLITNKNVNLSEVQQNEIVQLSIQKIELEQCYKKSESHLNKLSSLQKLMSFEKPKGKNTPTDLLSYVKAMPSADIQSLIENMIQKIVIWNRKLDIYLYKPYHRR